MAKILSSTLKQTINKMTAALLLLSLTGAGSYSAEIAIATAVVSGAASGAASKAVQPATSSISDSFWGWISSPKDPQEVFNELASHADLHKLKDHVQKQLALIEKDADDVRGRSNAYDFELEALCELGRKALDWTQRYQIAILTWDYVDNFQKVLTTQEEELSNYLGNKNVPSNEREAGNLVLEVFKAWRNQIAWDVWGNRYSFIAQGGLRDRGQRYFERHATRERLWGTVYPEKMNQRQEDLQRQLKDKLTSKTKPGRCFNLVYPIYNTTTDFAGKKESKILEESANLLLYINNFKEIFPGVELTVSSLGDTPFLKSYKELLESEKKGMS